MKIKLLLLLFYPLVVFSQADNAFKRYGQFLKKDTNAPYAYLYGGFHLQYITPSRISTSGQGTTAGLGLNIGRFFTKKFHLGIYGSIKNRELFWPSHFQSAFAGDLADQANYNALGNNDSMLASYFVRTTRKKGELGGCGRLQYGISFSLPIKYFPLIKIYKGNVNELINKDASISKLTEDKDWIYMGYHITGIELALLYNHKNIKRIQEGGIPLSVNLFFEQNTLKKSYINNIDLHSFLDESFFAKYKKDYRFGIKFGLEF